MTVRQHTTVDPTTAPYPAPLALQAPLATRQQVFWQILLQSGLYGIGGGVFLLFVGWIQSLPYDGFSYIGNGFFIISLIIATVSGVVSGVAFGMIVALLTIIIFYPMRSPRMYQAMMFFIPLIMPIISLLTAPYILLDPMYFLLSTFTPTTIYMLWATQRITTSAIRRVGLASLPYYRAAPRMIDPYLPESRLALFDMAPDLSDRMEWLAGLGLLARWRGALLGRLDLRPGMRAVDLMAGTGAMSRALVRRVGAGNVTAVELAPGVAARLRGVAGVDVLEADALASGLPSGGADVVTCAFGTLGMRERDHVRLVDTVDRLLAPNGVVGMVDMTPPPSGALRWAYLAYLRFVVPAVARLFLAHPALYQLLHRFMRESAGLAGLARRFAARGYAVSLAPLDGGLATALVAMKPGDGERTV